MKRVRAAAVLAALGACLGGALHAQTPTLDAGTPDAQVERWMAERGLDSVLAAQWRRRLERAQGEERAQVGERLGRLYVRLLEKASTPERRAEIERLSQRLLEQVPRAEVSELRLDLAKASYLRAEGVLESERLRLASPAEVEEAERVLRAAAPQFQEIATRAHARVEALEGRERSSGNADSPEHRAEIAQARRLRSLARYYAGWTRYYLASRSGQQALAAESAADFGWLLGAQGGRAPALERVPRDLMRFEHVARAAVGVALGASLRGRDAEALGWLDAVEGAPDLPDSVRGQLLARRVQVLARAGRWADIEAAVRRARQPDRARPATPLSPTEARLLAVLGLEASGASPGPDAPPQATGAAADLARALAQVAMGDLLAQGEAGHVVDLVSRYGTSTMEGDTFIPRYVRGLQAFERAREEHARREPEEASRVDGPAADSGVAAQYREAALAFDAALAAPDAERFPRERRAAASRAALAYFFSGGLERAAEQFKALAEEPGASAEDRRDALWYAIVALDRAVEGGKVSLTSERDALAALYLERYPGTDNAARLLLRRAGRLLNDDEALRVLLGVPDGSPVREAARREAARILYQLYRRAPAARRADAAGRFLEVALPLLESDLALVTQDPARNTEAASRAVLRARQAADAALATSPPDLQTGERMIEAVAELETLGAPDARAARAEMDFRRVQIALLRDDPAGADEPLARLRASSGPLAEAADRLLYSDALARWRRGAGDARGARRVAVLGRRVLEALDPALDWGRDRTIGAVADAAAQASAELWDAERDPAMRDAALALDGRLFDSGVRSAGMLARLGRLREDVGDGPGALAAWNALLDALEPGGASWFEARYRSLRALRGVDAALFGEAMRQHEVLYPGYGPSPWGERIRALRAAAPAEPVETVEPAPSGRPPEPAQPADATPSGVPPAPTEPSEPTNGPSGGVP